MKNQLHVRVSNHTLDQLNQLTQNMGETQTGVVALAIDRMYREEIKMKHINSKIQKCMEVARAKGLKNLEFVELGDETLFEYAERNNLLTGNITSHDMNGYVGFTTVDIIDARGNVVKTLAHVSE